MPVRRAISAGRIPASPLAWSAASTPSSRARRSRLRSARSRRRRRRARRRRPARPSASVMPSVSSGSHHRAGGKTVTRQATIHRGQPEPDRGQQRVRREAPGRTGRAAVRLAELAVGEHPVVEVDRASARCPSRPMSSATSGSARRSVVAVDRDPAVASPGALDERQAAILGDRPVRRRQRLGDQRHVEVEVVHRRERRRHPARARAVGPTPGRRCARRRPGRPAGGSPRIRSSGSRSPSRMPLITTWPVRRSSTDASSRSSSDAVGPATRRPSQGGGSSVRIGRPEARRAAPAGSRGRAR